MIARWNGVVSKHDTVYHLGDFTLGGRETAKKYFCQLNGKIHILGNYWHHDKRWLPGRFRSSGLVSKNGLSVIIELPIVVLEYPKLSEGRFPQSIVLSHYAQARWERRHHGAWHLFGHSHGKYSTKDLAFDVGVDSNNFTPVSLDEVIIKMEVNGWQGKRSQKKN